MQQENEGIKADDKEVIVGQINQIVQPVFPMVLQYNNPESGKNWKLAFQSLPHSNIIFEGNGNPTRDELIEILAPSGAPVWLIPVIEVVIQSCIQNGKSVKPQN